MEKKPEKKPTEPEAKPTPPAPKKSEVNLFLS
jgi:hypothetical protein